jgi:hypothetical protein
MFDCENAILRMTDDLQGSAIAFPTFGGSIPSQSLCTKKLLGTGRIGRHFKPSNKNRAEVLKPMPCHYLLYICQLFGIRRKQLLAQQLEVFDQLLCIRTCNPVDKLHGQIVFGAGAIFGIHGDHAVLIQEYGIAFH